MSLSSDSTSNADVSLPFKALESIGKVYAFLDLEHPAVQWAVMRGMLVSASHVSMNPDEFISFMQAGIISAGSNSRIFNESIIELYRRTKFQNCRSRMRGMYFFGSRAEALARINDEDWPMYFKAENLVEFDLLCDEMPTVVDANWITYARVDSGSGRLPLDDLEWISSYWSGKAYNEAPVWEVIANGVALVLDEKIRRQCDADLAEKFPEALIPILMARLASEVGTRGGAVHPFLLRTGDASVELQYLMSDAEFHNRDIIQRMSKHPDFGKLAKLMSENETWKTPDLRPWNKQYDLSAKPIPSLGNIVVVSLHDAKGL